MAAKNFVQGRWVKRTIVMLNFVQETIIYMLEFSIVLQHRVIRSLKSFMVEHNDAFNRHNQYMVTDDLATQWARSSAAMISTLFWNILVLTLEG